MTPSKAGQHEHRKNHRKLHSCPE